MTLYRHLLGFFATLLFSTMSLAAMPMAPAVTSQSEFFPHQPAAVAKHADVHFAARAPPLAVINVKVTGGVTVIQGGAFALHEQGTVAALFGFERSTNAPNTADDVLLLPRPTSVGSARRAEPGVASHGGSLPTIGQGDTWFYGASDWY